MSEPLQDQVKRLAEFIATNVPGEPSQSEGAIDTAISILAKHYGPSADGAGAIADAVRRATENPGHMVPVDDAWAGFPLEGDEVKR